MTEKERMLCGKLYIANDDELKEDSMRCRKLLDKLNNTSFCDFSTRNEICKALFANFGKGSTINKPFYCDYGKNINIGENFYANYDCIFLDVNKIVIGNNVMLGPRVSIFTAGHPIDYEVRNSGLEYGYKVTIGDNVWIGGNTIINPGVKIGDNVVIGSGSVVTRDIPSNVIACGNPCKVLRQITKEDKNKWKLAEKEYYDDKTNNY